MKKQKLNYYEEFIKMTTIIEKTTNLFQNLIQNYATETLETKTKEIHQLENESDSIVFSVKKYLISDFLPPIDREDIGNIVYNLDNIEDSLDEISKNFFILNIQEMKEQESKEYLDLLWQAIQKTKDIFQKLDNKKNSTTILEKIQQLNKIEDTADRVYEKYMKNLYQIENPIEIMKWTRIYDGYEELFDNYQTVANCIEEIIIKSY